MASYNHNINLPSSFFASGSPTPTPHNALHIAYAHAKLNAEPAETKRKVVASWFKDNIVPLVGETAAAELEKILNKAAIADVQTFLDEAIKFRADLEK